MDKIITTITTPLALGALAILVLGGILQQAKVRKDVVNSLFWLILVFGVLGNIGYLANVFVFSDAFLRGSVRDEAGNPVARSIVDIDGVGRTATAEDGSFEKLIPFSVQAASYRVITEANGFGINNTEVKGARPEFVKIILKKQTIALDEIIDFHDQVSILQNIGDPLFSIGFRFKHQKNFHYALTFTRVDLTTPSGSTISLTPLMVSKDNLAFQVQYLNGIFIDYETVGSEFIFVFSNDQPSKATLFQDLSTKFDPNWLSGCLASDGLEAGAVNVLQKYFDSAFTWRPGEYSVNIYYRIGDENGSLHRKLTISQSENEKLYAMRKKIGRCGGMLFVPAQLANLTYRDSEASNFFFYSASK